MIRTAAFALRIFAVYAVLSVACFLMLRTIIGYTSFKSDVQFLALKQYYVHNPIWITAFYIHVFSAIIALLSGFTQFSTQLMRENPQVHRFIGKIYVATILIINFPVGLIMGICANGGFLGKSAFLTLDVIWFYFTWKAYDCARKRRFVDHKNFMIRSYALTFSAFTLRLWRFIFVNTMVIHDMAGLYILDAWLGFLPNLAVAEVIIRQNAIWGLLPQRPKTVAVAAAMQKPSSVKKSRKAAVNPANLA